MADAWLVVGSAELDSHCGDYSGDTLAEALDGTDNWQHRVDEVHWFILDLGVTYTIKKVRGRSHTTADPIDVDIYVSDSKVDWGTAVATGISTWQDGGSPGTPWVEIDTTDKDGRYLKAEINDTENVDRTINWRATNPDYSTTTIFDVYGDVAGGAALTHTASDTMTISDSIATKSVMKFAKSDTMTIGDDIATKSVMKHATADTMAIADALVASLGFHVSLSDTMAIADSIEAKLTVAEIARLKALVRKLGLPTPANIGVGL